MTVLAVSAALMGIGCGASAGGIQLSDEKAGGTTGGALAGAGGAIAGGGERHGGGAGTGGAPGGAGADAGGGVGPSTNARFNCAAPFVPKVASSATSPSRRTEPWYDDYVQLQQRDVAKANDVVFVGDSITAQWKVTLNNYPEACWGNAAFDARFAGPPYNATVYGIGGDTTQSLLYRLRLGQLDGLAGKTKVVVLMIGTNNVGANSASEIVSGIEANLYEVLCRIRGAKVVLVGLTPANQDQASAQKRAAVNAALAQWDDGRGDVTYLDINEALGTPTSKPQNFCDSIHLSPQGYEVYAAALEPVLRRLLEQ